MRNIAKLTLFALFLIVSCDSGASSSLSVDDDVSHPMPGTFRLKPSWSLARLDAERLNHVLDILLALEDCECAKARAILEKDLSKAQTYLTNTIKYLQQADAAGNAPEYADLHRDADRQFATDSLKNAEKYWLSRPTKSRTPSPR